MGKEVIRRFRVRRDAGRVSVMTMHLETRAIHAPAAELNGSRPVSVPIYQTSVFAFDDAAACARALGDHVVAGAERGEQHGVDRAHA